MQSRTRYYGPAVNTGFAPQSASQRRQAPYDATAPRSGCAAVFRSRKLLPTHPAAQSIAPDAECPLADHKRRLSKPPEVKTSPVVLESLPPPRNPSRQFAPAASRPHSKCVWQLRLVSIMFPGFSRDVDKQPPVRRGEREARMSSQRRPQHFHSRFERRAAVSLVWKRPRQYEQHFIHDTQRGLRHGQVRTGRRIESACQYRQFCGSRRHFDVMVHSCTL